MPTVKATHCLAYAVRCGLPSSFGFLFLCSAVQIIKRHHITLNVESSEDKLFFLISMVSEEVDQVDVAAC